MYVSYILTFDPVWWHTLLYHNYHNVHDGDVEGFMGEHIWILVAVRPSIIPYRFRLVPVCSRNDLLIDGELDGGESEKVSNVHPTRGHNI